MVFSKPISNPRLNPVSRLFAAIETAPVRPAWCVLTLVASVLVRIVLEWTFEAQKTVEPLQSLLLFILYFSSVLCILVLLLWRFSGNSLESALKVVATFSPVLWIPPFLDVLLSSGKGFSLTFNFNPGSFLDGLFSFCATCAGVSTGLRLEVLVAILVAAAYVWHASRNAFKTVAVAAFFYLFVIIQAFLPGILMAYFGHAFADVFLFRELVSVYALVIAVAVVWAASDQASKKAGSTEASASRQPGFAPALRQKARNWFCRVRMERALHYVGLVLMAALIGKAAWGHVGFGALLPLSSLCAGTFLAFQAAVWLNDHFDRAIDRVTVPKKKADAEPFARIALFYAAGILCAWAAGYVAGVMVLFASALSVVYSAPPLRLRRHFLLASAVLAGCSLAVFFAGLTVGLAQPETGVGSEASGRLAALIGGFVLLASQFKDLKDADGDGRNGIFTLPGWLGVDRARNVVAALVGLAVLWATALSGLYWPVGLAFGLFGAGSVVLFRDFRRMETAVFILDYAFMAVLALHLSGILVLA